MLALFLHLALITQTPQKNEYDIQFVQIPMRDGVKLGASVFLPRNDKAKHPAIFSLTPYIDDGLVPRGIYFAAHGLPFIAVDCRGRGNSEGTFTAFEGDGQDGYDVSEWIAKQPFCNGKVGMWGGSYLGYSQWATIKELPPHLETAVPTAAVKPGADFPSCGGIPMLYDMQWLTYTWRHSLQTNLFDDDKFWNARNTGFARSGAAFSTFDTYLGLPSPTFQAWVCEPPVSARTDANTPRPAQYAAITKPILTITGQYDADQIGAMTYYREHMKYGNAKAKAEHYLIIGPWDHPGTRTPVATFAGQTFGEKSVIDMNDLHAQWYKWRMAGGPKPAFLKKRVAAYLVGADEWVYADNLEDLSKHTQTYALRSDSADAKSIFEAGRLDSNSSDSPGRDLSFTYDPKDRTLVDLQEKQDPNDPADATELFSRHGDGLVFCTPRFDKDTDFTGTPSLKLWIQTDVPDVDLEADLYLIKPNGKIIGLTGGQLRGRWKDSMREPKLLPLNQPTLFEFTNMNFFSRRVPAGSRLMLDVTCPSGSDNERNYCSDKPVEQQTIADARTAHIRLLTDKDHRSELTLLKP